MTKGTSLLSPVSMETLSLRTIELLGKFKAVALLLSSTALICLTFAPYSAADADKQKSLSVMSSIKPIQLITTSIVGNLGESTVLLPPSANPHHYQLKPSQLARLNSAELFIWVGPELELFLVRVLRNRNIKNLPLASAIIKHNSPATDSDFNQQGEGENDHGNLKTNGHHHDHDHEKHDDSNDPHIWLDPALALKIADHIYHHLAELHPALSNQLKKNLTTFKKQLTIKDAEIQHRLESLKGMDIYTFHNVYGRFASHYGLEVAGNITETPESRPGAKHLSQLSKEIKDKKTICLVKEPNFEAPYIQHLTDDVKVITTTVDPVAGSIENSGQGYIKFLESIADGLLKCVS